MAILFFEMSRITPPRTEAGPYNELILSISFFVLSFSGSDMTRDAMKAKIATPRKIGKIMLAELMACFRM